MKKTLFILLCTLVMAANSNGSGNVELSDGKVKILSADTISNILLYYEEDAFIEWTAGTLYLEGGDISFDKQARGNSKFFWDDANNTLIVYILDTNSIDTNDVNSITGTFTGTLTVDDINILNPSMVYDLSHDSFADYVANEHHDWTAGTLDFVTTGSGKVSAFTVEDLADTLVFDGLTLQNSGSFGIGALTPNYKLSIGSTDDTDQIGIYHDNTNAYVKWNDGALRLETDEGENTKTYVEIRGKGNLQGYLHIYDQDNTDYMKLNMFEAVGYVYLSGSGYLNLQHTADGDVRLFGSGTEGETQELQIYGYRTDDASRSLEIGVGVDGNDMASFDGVTNYYFDGHLYTGGLISAGTQIIGDVTNTEALLIRKNADGGDVFIVDTSSDIMTMNGAASITGDTTLGDASTDTITCTGRWIPRTVAADPTGTATAGNLGEIVFFNDKWYGKTVGTGSDTNWAALN